METDGGSDAATSDATVDAGPVILCSAATIAAVADAGRALLFCDDFDTVADPRTGWTKVFVQQDAGAFSLDTATFASAPQSAKLAYFSDQFASFWMLEKVALPATYTLSFDLYFDPVPFEVEVMRAVQLGGPLNAIDLIATPGSPSAMRFGVGAKPSFGDSGLMATDTWHHVVAHAESDTIHFTIDAVDFGMFPFPRQAGAPPGSVEIEVSPNTMVSAAAATAWFDNVEVTTP